MGQFGPRQLVRPRLADSPKGERPAGPFSGSANLSDVASLNTRLRARPWPLVHGCASLVSRWFTDVQSRSRSSRQFLGTGGRDRRGCALVCRNREPSGRRRRRTPAGSHRPNEQVRAPGGHEAREPHVWIDGTRGSWSQNLPAHTPQPARRPRPTSLNKQAFLVTPRPLFGRRTPAPVGRFCRNGI